MRSYTTTHKQLTHIEDFREVENYTKYNKVLYGYELF